MTNRLLLAVLSSCLLMGAPVAVAAPAAQSPQPAPNIVILFADDLGYGDLGSYGHPAIRTPNLDALATAGQRWTDFYAAAPVCSPSRGALLTGQYPVRSGLYGQRINVLFPNDVAGMPDQAVTLAEQLRTAGYATAIVGKWHLGDQGPRYPTRHGFDRWFGLPYSNDMDWVGFRSFDEVLALSTQGRQDELASEFASRRQRYFEPRTDYWNVPLIRSSRSEEGYHDELLERPTNQRTLTKRYTEEAIRFIESSAGEQFFLYLPYTMPHTPIFRSNDFAGHSRAGRYGDVIEEIDWSVGRITATLDRLELSDNTLLVFTSDNGPWLTMNSHGGSAGLLKMGKGTTFEGGMRVPAVFSWPGTIVPGVVSGIGSAMDLYATALRLAGVEANGSGHDSVDLTPTLLDPNHASRREFAYYRGGELRAYRQGPWKLHFVTQGAYQQGPERTEHTEPLLYHLGEDPAERFDVAATHPDIVSSILAAVQKHRDGMVIRPPIFDERLARMGNGTP